MRYARIVTGKWLRENSMNDFLTQSIVGALVGGVILTLAALGIHGVVGLMVATRTREIAVRVALGASRRRVMGLILRDVVMLAAPGIGFGLILTVALMRLNSEIRELSFNRAPISTIRAAAIRAGMRTLLQDGKIKVLRGETTEEEIAKFAQAETLVETNVDI